MSTPELAIGVDLGGTKVAVAVVDRHGQLLGRNIAPTPARGSADDICDAIEAGVRLVAGETDISLPEVAGLGVGVPGRVDPDRGMVIKCPNLHALDGVAIVDEITKRIPSITPVKLANDAEVAGLAELRYGAAREVSNMVLLTLGTGIGGAVALSNRIVRGPRRILGELGHMVLDPFSGRKCGCGNFGCFETLAAKQALTDMALAGLQSGRASIIDELTDHDPTRVSPRLICKAALAGDEFAREIYARAGHWIGVAVCNLIILCDPDLVLIGGGIAAAGEILFQPIRRTVSQRSRISGFDARNIIPAMLGNEAGVYGASALVWEE